MGDLGLCQACYVQKSLGKSSTQKEDVKKKKKKEDVLVEQVDGCGSRLFMQF